MRTFIYAFGLISVLSFSTLTAEETKPDTQTNSESEASLQAKRDKLRIAVQKICPVSGNKLGSHGDPVKAKIGKQTMFLCCKACTSGKVNPTHWKTIHANFAKAQAICPVMKHKLPAKPKYTIVAGQLFYVCCEPCTKKIEESPKTYLAKLDQLHVASLAGNTASGTEMPVKR